jgi:hypothetical protein
VLPSDSFCQTVSKPAPDRAQRRRRCARARRPRHASRSPGRQQRQANAPAALRGHDAKGWRLAPGMGSHDTAKASARGDLLRPDHRLAREAGACLVGEPLDEAKLVQVGSHADERRKPRQRVPGLRARAPALGQAGALLPQQPPALRCGLPTDRMRGRPGGPLRSTKHRLGLGLGHHNRPTTTFGLSASPAA